MSDSTAMAGFSRDRDVSGPRRPAGDLIDAVVENMRENREELKYSTVAPSRYSVLLSPAEYARLEGIIPRLQAETIRALSEELDRLNQPSWVQRRMGGWLGRAKPSIENADAQWHVEFLPDIDGELEHDQDIIVHSELLLPHEPDLGGGERTRRITTVHRPGTTGTTATTATTGATVNHGTGASTGATGATGATAAAVHARLVYTDGTGRHSYDVVRDSTTIGRGGITYPVDVRVTTSEDVSREHARIRRDPATGAFFLIDLSSLGTTLNGRHVPRGVEEVDGTKRENGAESELPARARIGLAETVFIDFERLT